MPLRLISRKLFFMLFAAVLLTASCKKDHDNDPPVKDPVLERKITKLFQDQNNYVEFIYNTGGNLWKIRAADEDTPGGVQNFEVFYNDNKRIESISTNEGYRIHYRYENDKLSRTEIKDDKGFVLTSGSFYYENDNLVDYGYFLPFEMDDVPGGIRYNRVSESKYQYNADRTIRSIKTNLRNIITDKMEYAGERVYEKYDGKINPLKFLGDFAYGFFQELNPSNNTREVAYDSDGVVEEVIDRSFSYDSFGYPTTCVEKTTETGKAAVTKTLTFTYQ